MDLFAHVHLSQEEAKDCLTNLLRSGSIFRVKIFSVRIIYYFESPFPDAILFFHFFHFFPSRLETRSQGMKKHKLAHFDISRRKI